MLSLVMRQAYRYLNLQVSDCVNPLSESLTLLSHIFQMQSHLYATCSVVSITPLMIHHLSRPGRQVLTSVASSSADCLLLAWYHRHKQDVLAVMTDDSDFYVYGVEKVETIFLLFKSALQPKCLLKP